MLEEPFEPATGDGGRPVPADRGRSLAQAASPASRRGRSRSPGAALASLVLALIPCLAQAVEDPGVEYRIEARLYPREQVLTGRAAVDYRNESTGPVDAVYFQLGANTHRDRYSTAAREKDFYHDESIRRLGRDGRGYIDIEGVAVGGEAVRYRVLDTQLRVELARPLAPGAVANIELVWFERIRRLTDGAGRAGDHVVLADWYPQVARLADGEWDAEPIHDVGRQVGAFADFDVSLTLPRGMVVVATGQQIGSADPAVGTGVGAGDAARTVRFRAESVHDFAMVIDPGYEIEQLRCGSTLVTVARPLGVTGWDEAGERVRAALEAFESELGPFPYPHLTVAWSKARPSVVLPMLVLVAEPRLDQLTGPIASQYFGGAVAADGLASAWLTQGLAAWAGRRQSTGSYGPAGRPAPDDVYGRRLRRTSERDRVEARVLRTGRIGRHEPVATPAHLFRDRANYLPSVRDRASLFFDGLRASMGDQEFFAALAEFQREARYAHAGEADLLRAVGANLESQFTAWLHTPTIPDPAVVGVTVSPSPNGGNLVAVKVRREPGPGLPVELVARADDGSEVRRMWDGLATESTIEFHLDAGLDQVCLDPAGTALDANRFNNCRPRQFELVTDWPLQDYAPAGSYVIAWRPSLWYDLVDGVRLGFTATGARERVIDRLEFAPSIDVKRGRFDLEVGYSTPLFRLGRSELALLGHKAEGRRLLSAAIRTNLSARLERRPQTWLELGMSSFTVSDLDYGRPMEYDRGTVNRLWLRYGGAYAGPGWKGEAAFDYSVAGPQIDSDYAFNRVALTGHVAAASPIAIWHARTFVGLSSDGDRLPRQLRFYLAGAGPMETFSYPGLRSRDSVLTFLNYHLPGDGNLRGYNDGASLSARRLLAINLELERPLRIDPDGPVGQWLDGASLAVFGDMAKAEGTGVAENANPMFGIGAGVRVHRELYGRPILVRFDVPFYLNRPGIDTDGRSRERLAPRWLLSLSPAF